MQCTVDDKIFPSCILRAALVLMFLTVIGVRWESRAQPHMLSRRMCCSPCDHHPKPHSLPCTTAPEGHLKHTACSYLQSALQNTSPQLLKKKGQRKRKCRAAAVPYSKQLLRTVTSMHEMRPTFGHASGSNNTRYILQLKLMKIHAPLSCRRDYWWSFG